ncbi:MAG: hypothetical protein US11_C0002G0043 [Candidatus Roizmanbacteria bacterium GW2011_GWA2_36_23]|uniref:CAAX prenyl protease 2/Lysostaphin resistance protein A-like domain-containing protein n=1 Tax=Candidatus Roizmanbacteria bacterium GW2011_GWA2_36_23 TaxID=1618480 RepID=A0A0G0GQA5_9BACT|nr:MAG: hypothetical protein US11_C0002G0043 [Candidatus Roizmanbacteria bacterium GW2011_GWA2_36_23]
MAANKISPTQRALNLWAIILIIWAIYRANLKMPEWFDELIAKPLVFVLPVYWYIKNIDKKDLFSSLYIKPKLFFQDLIYGVFIGGIFFLTAIFANFLKSGELFKINNAINSQNIALIIILAIATGISEEILSRGFVLKKLYEESKNIYTASFFASILFFFLHVPILFTNVKLVGNLLLLFMATDIILSLVNSFLFLDRKSLFLPILIHAFYNIALIFFI